MDSTLTLRRAGTTDEAAIARVAAVDSSVPPKGETLVVAVDGKIVAAMSLDEGAVVADPFEPTADLVEALRLRRTQLHRAHPAGVRSRWRPSFPRPAARSAR